MSHKPFLIDILAYQLCISLSHLFCPLLICVNHLFFQFFNLNHVPLVLIWLILQGQLYTFLLFLYSGFLKARFSLEALSLICLFLSKLDFLIRFLFQEVVKVESILHINQITFDIFLFYITLSIILLHQILFCLCTFLIRVFFSLFWDKIAHHQCLDFYRDTPSFQPYHQVFFSYWLKSDLKALI